METGQQSVKKIDQAAPRANGGALPTVAANDPVALWVVPPAPGSTPVAMHEGDAVPIHTKTQSTLAPTSEWVRYLLLALPSRYIPRGIFGALFETNAYEGNVLGRGLKRIAEGFQKKFNITSKNEAEHASALVYGMAMGIGSLVMSASYSWTVYKDIKNIFCESVAAETGKPPEEIKFTDLRKSDNRIVQVTIGNFWKRTMKRVGTDLLFFPAALARSTGLGDLMVGVKAGQALGETWKRKTTMFEDLITFVNNKINPRNGLGQAIGVGEVFDLYQHYEQEYNPSKAFTNVLERGTGESARWAQNQPIFTRLTELMNLTYAYKHSSMIDPQTGQIIHQANFALPKFIYLLGHDLIDVNKPQQTLATIEIANSYGIAAVKDMQAMLKAGQPLEAVEARFPVAPHVVKQHTVDTDKKNGVIAKGSTVQIDAADDMPQTTVAADSIAEQSVLHAAPNMSAIA